MSTDELQRIYEKLDEIHRIATETDKKVGIQNGRVSKNEGHITDLYSKHDKMMRYVIGTLIFLVVSLLSLVGFLAKQILF